MTEGGCRNRPVQEPVLVVALFGYGAMPEFESAVAGEVEIGHRGRPGSFDPHIGIPMRRG